MGLGVTVLMVGLGGACVEEEESVIVLGMPLPAGLGSGEALECKVAPGGSTWLQDLALDLSFNTGLSLPLELQNNLLSVDGNSVNSGVDNSEMRLRSVDVELSVPQVPAVEEAVRAVNPNYLAFNLPMASDSFSGGKTRRAIMVNIPADTMSKFRDALIANGFVNAAEVVMQVELRFHMDLTGGQGKIVSRAYRAPVRLSLGALRACLPTSWRDPAAAEGENKVYELCTQKNCESPNMTDTNYCGNAQLVRQSPKCCDGPEAWENVPNAPEVCGVPR